MLSKQKPALIRAKLLLGCCAFLLQGAWAALLSGALGQAVILKLQLCLEQHKCKEPCRSCCREVGSALLSALASLGYALNPIGAMTWAPRYGAAMEECEAACREKPRE